MDKQRGQEDKKNTTQSHYPNFVAIGYKVKGSNI